jgi:hypothetical protein
MPKLVDKWAGRLYGTNTGNFFIELKQEGENLTGVLRIMDNLYGLSIYDITGSYRDKIIFHCVPRGVPNGQLVGEVTAEAELTIEGNLKGTWHSTIGTAGTFDAYPHDIRTNVQSDTRTQGVPEQIFNKNIPIGSIRLFSEDVKRLIAFIEQDFRIPRSIVTYTVRGSQATKYSDDFLREVETLGEIKYLKISIQEPEAYGINRIIVVELLENGPNEVRVSGISEAWVLGKAESIAQVLRPQQNSLVTTYRKYGLNLYAIIFFAMLILIPEVKSWQDRSVFVLFVFLLLTILLWIHRRFIPNAIIYLTGKEPSFFARSWPTIVSWLVAASSSIFAALVFYLLTKSKNP